MSSKQTRPPVRPGARSASSKPAPAKNQARGARTFKATANESAAGQWFRSMHLSLEMVTILAIVVAGILALAPQAQIWFQQRQRIADATAQLAQARADLAKMKVTRTRWEDPVYIRSQARDRLYYVMPGEVSYLVMDEKGINTSDVSGTMGAKLAAQRNTSEISTSILRTKKNWVNSIMESVVRAGLEEPTTTGNAKTPVGK